jgi:hypothetical protein
MNKKGPWYYPALDLGQPHEFTAFTVLERTDPKDGAPLSVRHLERFPLRTTYPAIIERVRGVLESEELAGRFPFLAVDFTGVGEAVRGKFYKERMNFWPMYLTGGREMTREGNMVGLPKMDLVSVLHTLFEAGRIKVARELPEAETLTRELLDFKMKPGKSEEETPWREGAQDDLVLAVGLACWQAEKNPPPKPKTLLGRRMQIILERQRKERGTWLRR